MKFSRVLLGIGVAAAGGLLVFGLMVWRSVTVEQASPDEALDRFMMVRSTFAGTEPILHVDPNGRVVRSKEPPTHGPAAKSLRVLAYRVPEGRLAQAKVALWFLKVKGPAVRYSVRGTGLDLDRLAISADDLARYGPSLVFDETAANGGRLLVWTE